MALRVNGEEIPEGAIRHELDRLVKFYSQYSAPEEIKAQLPLLRRKAKEQAIGTKLLVDQANKLDLVVTEADVDEGLQQMVEKVGGQERFREIIKAQRINPDVIRDSIRQGRKVDALIARVTSEVADPTEGEMREHFEKHQKEYMRPDRASASHILLRPASSEDADLATTRARAMELRQQIQDGASFADLAAAHSECPSGKEAGGSLGWFSRGMMIPEFDQAVFEMDVDELSEPVETSEGFHLIYKTGHEAGGPVTFEEISDRVRDLMRHAARGEAITAYVNELRSKAVVEDDEPLA